LITYERGTITFLSHPSSRAVQSIRVIVDPSFSTVALILAPLKADVYAVGLALIS
jgi:hypothetical protein